MDFDSCFLDCCKSRNPTCQTYKSPASGQGDCQCSGEASCDQNFLVNPERGKAFTNKNGKEKAEWKDEKRKKLLDVHCDCYSPCGKKLECKLRRSGEQEKTELDILEAGHVTWDHRMIPDGCNSKMGGKSSKETQFLVQNYLQLEEKVDFLRRLFQDCDQKLSDEGYVEQSQMKATDPNVTANVWQLLNLNRRMCAAEEGIEKLSEILKELIKVSTRRKDPFFSDDDLYCGSSVNFDDLNIRQRINFLKTRNDLLTSFVISFLGSVNEICSRLAALPKEEPMKPIPMNSKIQFGGKDQTRKLDPDEVFDTFKKLNIPFNDVQEKKTLNYRPSYNQNLNRLAKNDEHCGLKYSGNKLEVISEQAEFALNRIVDTDKVIGEIKKNTLGKNLKGKFSQVSTEGRGKGVEVSDSTSRLLAQEAVLKSSLDQVHLELLSKLDSEEKTKLNVTSLLDISRKVDNKIWESESNLGSSSSEVSCANCEAENREKSASKSAPQISNKRSRLEELKDAIKEEKSFFLGNNPNNSNRISCKSGEDQSDGNKNKLSKKILHKSSYTVLTGSRKPKPGPPAPGDHCSSAQGRRRSGEAAGDQRPLTAPSPQRKCLPPPAPAKSPSKNCLKSSAPGEGKKRNSGLANNVRYKNKVLVSKKSFVRTQP